jgi:hypothetical protein
VCAGRVESQSSQSEGVIEGLLLQRECAELKNSILGGIEGLLQGVRAGVFLKTRVVEKAQKG